MTPVYWIKRAQHT